MALQHYQMLIACVSRQSDIIGAPLRILRIYRTGLTLRLSRMRSLGEPLPWECLPQGLSVSKKKLGLIARIQDLLALTSSKKADILH